jgi:hypothetical protein
MKGILYFIVFIALVSGGWYLATGTTPQGQVEYIIRAKFLNKVEDGASNTAKSASKLGKTLKGQLEEAQDVYHNGAEAKYN